MLLQKEETKRPTSYQQKETFVDNSLIGVKVQNSTQMEEYLSCLMVIHERVIGFNEALLRLINRFDGNTDQLTLSDPNPCPNKEPIGMRENLNYQIQSIDIKLFELKRYIERLEAII